MKVYAKSGTANIRQEANTSSKVVGKVTTTDGVEFISSSKQFDGYTWHKVKGGYVREDVGIIKSVSVGNNLERLRTLIKNARINRKIEYAFVHCTANQNGASIESIKKYWKEKLGWKNVGYHIILTDDSFEQLTSFENISNGASGYNSNGIHISYIGGIDSSGKAKDTRTQFQKEAIGVFLEEITSKIKGIKVLGHNEVANKACPSFKVKDEYPQFWTGK